MTVLTADPARLTALNGDAQSQFEERRQHILSVAIECIAECGYDGVRLREVSKRAGVSVGLIQHYFENREKLLAAAIKFLSESLLLRFAELDDESMTAWQKIEALIDQVCSVPDLSRHSYMWLSLGAAVSKHPELRPALENVYATWERYVRASVDAGLARQEFDVVGDPEDAVKVFLAFFDGYEYDMATGLIPADPAELRRRALLMGRALFRPAAA